MRRAIAGLSGKKSRALDQISIIGNEHSASRSGDDLVAVEGENTDASVRACTSSGIDCAKRLGRILNYWYAVVRAGFLDLGVVRRFAIQIDHDHCARQPPAAGTCRQLLAKECGINVPTC